MPRIPSPLHDKSVPRSVSKPTVTAEAAATVAESAVAPKAKRSKAKPAPAVKKAAAPARKAVSGAKKAAPQANKAAASATKAKAKAVPAKKAKPAPAVKSKPEAKSAPAAAATPAPAKPAKIHKPKPKLVRDSFTIPKDEYAVLESLKARALGLGQHVRKSELLRAGIQALHAMADRAFLDAVGAVPTLKTGRPSKG